MASEPGEPERVESVRQGAYRVGVLDAGSPIPDVLVWTAPRQEAQPLREVLGEGLTLLCFYIWNWSPT